MRQFQTNSSEVLIFTILIKLCCDQKKEGYWEYKAFCPLVFFIPGILTLMEHNKIKDMCTTGLCSNNWKYAIYDFSVNLVIVIFK